MATTLEFNLIGVDRASAAFDSAASSARSAAADIDRAGDQARASFDGVADGADTIASKGAQAGGALNGLGDLIGGPFGAAMQVGGTAMQAFGDAGDLMNAAMEGGKRAVDAIKNSAIAQRVATVAGTVATKAATAAQWLWNAAMKANPIGLIIAGIAALIAIVVLLVKNWDTVRAAGAAAWNWIKGVWSAASAWFNGNVVQPIVRWFSGLRSSVTGAFSSAWDTIKGVWGGVSGWFGGVIAGVKRVFSGIGSALSAPFRAAFNGIRSFWNDTIGGKGFTVPGWIPGVGGRNFRIPMLATGGTIARGGWAVVGERGPEVVNLPTGSTVYPNHAPPQTGGGLHIENFHAGGMSPGDVANALAWEMGRVA